jgi:streptomycin 6-kinase
MEIPSGLDWLRTGRTGQEWLDRLPKLVEECSNSWSLRVGEPFPYAFASIALAAERADGSQAVLKIQFPHGESEFEAAALTTWNGDGAVRLLEFDAGRHALLLERCSPGTALSDVPADDALDIVIGLLPRLWKKAGSPFRSLREEANEWAGELEGEWERAGEPFERRMIDAALEFWAAANDAPGEQVLVNQDMHAGNVLRADREPWLVIDPKPLVGEREFGIAALIRGGELGEGPDAVRHRFDRLTAELGLDRDRARGWAFSQTLAWSHEDGLFDVDVVEVARWIFNQ